MHNIVIFSKNLNFIKKYSNLLSLNFDDIKILGIVSSKQELSILDNQNIDLIILSSTDLSKKYLQNYFKCIKTKIIICLKSNSSNRTKDYIYINENLNNSLILNAFHDIFQNISEIPIKNEFRNLMKSLDFNFKLKGTNYLLEAITYSYINKSEYLYENLEKNIYSYLSKKYNVTSSVIKHSIIRAVNNTNSNKLKSHFKNLDNITSKSLITEFVNIF